jgi:hypothetical protein
MRFWDGGAFQAFLPDLLISERSYSARMLRVQQNFSEAMRKQGETYPWGSPAAHSACFFKSSDQRFFYNGRAGLLSQTSVHNMGARSEPARSLWESAYTPHALFLAMLDLPTESWQRIRHMESLQEKGLTFFRPEWGWLDAWHIGWGGLVNLQISLDQLMIALSIQRYRSPDKKIASSRRLEQNKEVREKLLDYYKTLDQSFDPAL